MRSEQVRGQEYDAPPLELLNWPLMVSLDRRVFCFSDRLVHLGLFVEMIATMTLQSIPTKQELIDVVWTEPLSFSPCVISTAITL